MSEPATQQGVSELTAQRGMSGPTARRGVSEFTAQRGMSEPAQHAKALR